MNSDFLVLFLVETVSEGSSSRFVDNAEDFEAAIFACIFGRVPLRVVEVSRDGDNRLSDLFAELASASALSLARIIAETSGGEKVFFSPFTSLGREHRRWRP
jgi:hypothetical protein